MCLRFWELKAKLGMAVKKVALCCNPCGMALRFFKVVHHFCSMTSRIKSFVSRMPSLATVHTLLMERSTPFLTMPSPP